MMAYARTVIQIVLEEDAFRVTMMGVEVAVGEEAEVDEATAMIDTLEATPSI